MAVYALDTNVIICYQQNNINVITKIAEAIKNKHTIVIPYIVDYEMRRGFAIKHAPRNELSYNKFSSPQGFCRVVSMGDSYLTTAAQVYAGLYRKDLTVGDIDILIASFCIHNGYILVSDNTKHFINIDGLQLTNWKQ
ncbi:MAG: PIN domain-containing protein [Defluviitaleaceae bacterium]|nr:PIN domain-containing protein [Defluviitaleaceae bacterium]MCL2275975.1 PIN domain-containing protein [Defluviitaleaceae bacterium]